MSAAAVIAEALSAGVQVRLDDGVVKVKGAPSPELLAKLREHKAEIMAILSGQACIDCGAAPGAFELGGFGAGWWRCTTCLKRHLYPSDLSQGKRAEAARRRVEENSTALADAAETMQRGPPS